MMHLFESFGNAVTALLSGSLYLLILAAMLLFVFIVAVAMFGPLVGLIVTILFLAYIRR